MVSEQVIKTGLAVLQGHGDLLTEVQPDHQTAVPKVLIPRRNTIGEPVLGTSATGGMPCCESVTVMGPSQECYSYGTVPRKLQWWRRGESNPRHSGYEPNALTN